MVTFDIIINWMVFIVDHRPIILVYKARKLRQTTGDNRYYAALERNVPRPRQIINKVLARPFLVLFNEPMLMAMTAYLSVGVGFTSQILSYKIAKQFAYGCLYLMFEAYPIVFTVPHKLSPGIAGLTFLPIAIGGTIAVLIVNLLFSRLLQTHFVLSMSLSTIHDMNGR